MKSSRLSRLQSPWIIASVGATVSIAAASAVIGLIWLPLAQSGLELNGVWDAICSAAGVPRNDVHAQPIQPTFKTSEIVVTSGMLTHQTSFSIGHGATLAQRCAICHGVRGEGGGAVPNLAGQHAAAVYKELDDFQTGACMNAVMGPFAKALSGQDMLDLAAYYSDLPRSSPNRLAVAARAPSIVVNGAPMRNVAPCSACHGGMDVKTGAPWLAGQSTAYMKSQLQAFAAGTRHNDISLQMRNVARGMTPQEMDEAVGFYAPEP